MSPAWIISAADTFSPLSSYHQNGDQLCTSGRVPGWDGTDLELTPGASEHVFVFVGLPTEAIVPERQFSMR